jgi:hypothetical protein
MGEDMKHYERQKNLLRRSICMKKAFAFLLLVIYFTGFYGCAGSTPTAEFKKPIADIHRLCLNDEATVKLVVADGVVLNEVNRQRLESRLKEAINTNKKNAPCKTSDKRSFILDSKITRYDEGNAFARTMMAGLGQIHIDGDFALMLLSATGSESMGEFTLQKTFAWGGLYGGTTRIEDVEPAFAAGVAEAIVVQSQDKMETTPTKQEMTQKTEK